MNVEPNTSKTDFAAWFASEYPDVVERFVRLLVEQYVLCQADPSEPLQVSTREVVKHIFGDDTAAPCLYCVVVFTPSIANPYGPTERTAE